MMMILNVQVTGDRDQHAAAGILLDLVTAQLGGGVATSFDGLVYALVWTEQLRYAKILDDKLTELYIRDKGTKHGQLNFKFNCNIISMH